MIGGQCVVLNEEPDPLTQRRDVTFSSLADFRARYQPYKDEVRNGDGEKKLIPITKRWLESEKRRQYQGIVFEPGRELGGYYNLWTGFAFKPKKGEWGRFQDHIHENICRGDPDLANWVISWMAHIVQNPGGPKPGTALVLRGKQGTGKGVFATMLGRVFGRHFLHVSQQGHITGRFNSHLKDTILLFGDEAFWAGDKRDAGVLKALITEPEHVLEEKFRNPIRVKNLVNLVLASNSDWVVPAEELERRFAVLDVGDNHRQDRGYFGKIVTQMKNGGFEAMLHDLLEWDTSVANVHVIPKTEALADQVVRTMKPIQGFWFECLCRGSVLEDQERWPGQDPKKAIYHAYIRYCEDRGIRRREGDRVFGRELRRLCPSITECRPVVSSGDRARCYGFPPLNEAREAFDEVMGVRFGYEDSS